MEVLSVTQGTERKDLLSSVHGGDFLMMLYVLYLKYVFPREIVEGRLGVRSGSSRECGREVDIWKKSSLWGILCNTTVTDCKGGIICLSSLL